MADRLSSFVPIIATVSNSAQAEANEFFNQSELSTRVTTKMTFDAGYNSIVTACTKR